MTLDPRLAGISYDPTDAGNFPGDGPLRIGGISVSGLPETGENLPSTRSPAAKEQEAALKVVRDVWDGTPKVRAATTAYLPQAGGEDPTNYQSRLARSVLFNVFRHTVVGLTGFMFRKDPELGEDVPAAIVEHCENIDLAGTHFAVFMRDIMADAEVAGHAAILVEFPDTGGEQSKAQEQGDAPIRPYWVPILKDNILSWRTVIEDGRLILTQLVLKECQWVPDGAFGQKEQTRYRVFFRVDGPTGPVVGFQLLEITEQKTVVEVGYGLYPTQVEIPVAEIPTAGRKALFESDPPLLDLAYLNIAHYQTRSDYANDIHKTCCPIWVETGVDEEDTTPIILGPNSTRRFRDPNSKAGYEAHSGQSLGEVKLALDDLLRDMAALGLAALASQKRAAETAASKQIDKDASDSALSVTARGGEDGAERALGFHARYMGLDTGTAMGGGSVSINRDFEDQVMRPEMLTAYVGAVANAGLPPRILLEAMQQGGLIGPDVDLEQLEAEMAANAQAAADAKVAAQKDALAAAQIKGGQQPGNAAGKPGAMPPDAKMAA
jgi:hypothetical protein